VLVDYFIVGVVIVVIAIPDNLPLLTTQIFADSSLKMLKENLLVKNL